MATLPGYRYKPINDYGLIGNRRSAALVGLDGSIDWCCLPRFDSPSIFAAILDMHNGGHFTITPETTYSSSQYYLGNTNVLETRFETDGGTCTLTDCMPVYRREDGTSAEVDQIIRQLKCHSGSVSLRVEYNPRPDYASIPVRLKAQGRKVVCTSDDLTLTLDSPVTLQVLGDRAEGVLTLSGGEEMVFVLHYQDTPISQDLLGLEPQHWIERTLEYWNSRVEDLDYEGPWQREVTRSYQALHLLTYRATGGIVAAPTASLPEEIGGVRNWDYRYTWLRDAALTIEALLSLGHRDEALYFFEWLNKVCTTYGSDIRIMYRVDAEEDLEEKEMPHLEGYLGSRPVRIGNGAYDQVQHDIYGHVLNSAYLLANRGDPITDAQWELLRTLANLAVARWREPDSGIWEVRGGVYHFVYSKAMCWVALDRAVMLANRTDRNGSESEVWERTAQAIKDEVLQRAWNEGKQAFAQHYDTDAMDASNLLLPLIGFLPVDDPRIASTVRRIREELADGPYVHRYLTEETDDGLTGGEGAFILCSFWLVQVLARMGEVGEARRIFEKVLAHANHLGLFAEMIDPRTGAALGNFPQAFTHVGLILAAREIGIAEGTVAS